MGVEEKPFLYCSSLLEGMSIGWPDTSQRRTSFKTRYWRRDLNPAGQEIGKAWKSGEKEQANSSCRSEDNDPVLSRRHLERQENTALSAP